MFPIQEKKVASVSFKWADIDRIEQQVLVQLDDVVDNEKIFKIELYEDETHIVVAGYTKNHVWCTEYRRDDIITPITAKYLRA